MKSVIILLTLFVTSANVAHAQHDPHRNAVRHVAAGKFEQAAQELKKADAEDPETQFVLMLNALGQDNTDAAVQHAKAALDAGLPFGRLVAGPRKELQKLYQTDAFLKWSDAHDSLKLVHGPMVGAVTHDEARFWVRTARTAFIQVHLFDKGGNRVAASNEVLADAGTDFTAVARVWQLKPATAYHYEVLIDGESASARKSFRTHPEPGKPAKFRIAFGGGAGFVPKWEHMWDTILKEQPSAVLMLGDNVYIDDPQHLLTQHYCYYRRQSRPEWRRLVSSTAMYSIWDDHDFGTNDCVPGSEIESPPWKRTVWAKFKQNWVNPSYGGSFDQPGCWYGYSIGDVHFLMLDGRYYRSREGTPSMLGPAQKEWLFRKLKSSTSRIKVLASPVPWSEGVKPGSRDPWDGFVEEREEVFSFIENNRIEGVILISADRHRSDLRVTTRPNGYDLYEFESSRLTNRHTHGVVKTPGLIWGYNKTCSFGLISFDTTKADPSIRFEVVTIDGEHVLSHDLSLSQLTFKEKQ